MVVAASRLTSGKQARHVVCLGEESLNGGVIVLMRTERFRCDTRKGDIYFQNTTDSLRKD